MEKTILIADDSESIREVVKATLENAGYGVIVAVDGADALEKLDGTKIDLVITDLNMPNKDGIQLIRDARGLDDYKFTPILLLTTESQAEKKQEAKTAGATGWIVKPFVQDKLLAVIKKVLR
ncbi:MAG: response regulator [Cytophagales bacterium]|nr:response regulator [Cytophagales bacterium]